LGDQDAIVMVSSSSNHPFAVNEDSLGKYTFGPLQVSQQQFPSIASVYRAHL
jgi:hypothetical protein